jgi:hypothetical protein
MSKEKMLDRLQSGLVSLASPNHTDDDKQRRKYQIGIRAYRNRQRFAPESRRVAAWRSRSDTGPISSGDQW